MNAKQNEILRDTILRSFRNMRSGLSLSSLGVVIASCGFKRAQEEDLEDEIQYFIDKGFLAVVPKSHSLGNKIWRITAAGVDDLESRGL